MKAPRDANVLERRQHRNPIPTRTCVRQLAATEDVVIDSPFANVECDSLAQS